MKNYVIRPPLHELKRLEQTPRRPGCGARIQRVGTGEGAARTAAVEVADGGHGVAVICVHSLFDACRQEFFL